MMPESREDLLRQGVDAFNRRDKAAWLRLCDPEAENFPPREWPENAPLRGAERIWEFFVDATEAWDDVTYRLGEIIERGEDKVVGHQQAEMRGKSSGAQVVWSYWVLFTFRHGKIARFEWFSERSDALEAAGRED